ncbi:MAG: fibronectin type III domain-containing protein [Planctomycetes bacterium]|nr:fibronectin type III domain-containing protein [Planctomycetota bacterium]
MLHAAAQTAIRTRTRRRPLGRRVACLLTPLVALVAAADVAPSGDVARLGARSVIELGSASIRAAAPTADGGLFVVGGRADGPFAARIAADLTTVVWSRSLGGTSADHFEAVAVSPDGGVWAAGSVATTVLPAPGGFRTTGGGAGDGYVARFDAVTGAPTYATYLGGLTEDAATSIDVDDTGRVLVAGRAGSDLPGRVGPSPSTGADAFVTAIAADGALLWSRYLGGTFDDFANAVAAAADGSVWVGGGTNSVLGGATFPTAGGPAWTTQRSGQDAFLAHLSQDGTTLLLSTVFGNPASDETTALAILDDGRVAVALAQDSLGIGGGESAPQYPSIDPLRIRTDDSKGLVGDTFYRRSRFAVLAADGASWSSFTGFPATRITSIVAAGADRVVLAGRALGETTPGAYLRAEQTGDGDPASLRAFAAWIDLAAHEVVAATRLDADAPCALALTPGAAVVVAGSASPATAGTAFRVPFPPAAVSGLRAVRRTDTSADIVWTHDGPVASFQVERRPAQTGVLDVRTVRETWYLRTRGAFETIGTVASSSRTFTDGTIPDAGDYEYRVIAIAPDGGARGGEFAACGTSHGRPPQITGARIVSQQGNRISVAWTDPRNAALAAEVYGPWVLERAGPGATSAEFTAIPFAGRPSRFQVRAAGGGQVSAASDEVVTELSPQLVVTQTRGHVSVSPVGRASASGRGRFTAAVGAPPIDPEIGAPRGVLAMSRMGALAVPDQPDRLVHLRILRSAADRRGARGKLRIDWRRGRYTWSATFPASRNLDLRKAESPLHVTIGLALGASGGAVETTWNRTTPHDFRIDR